MGISNVTSVIHGEADRGAQECCLWLLKTQVHATRYQCQWRCRDKPVVTQAELSTSLSLNTLPQMPCTNESRTSRALHSGLF